MNIYLFSLMLGMQEQLFSQPIAHFDRQKVLKLVWCADNRDNVRKKIFVVSNNWKISDLSDI